MLLEPRLDEWRRLEAEDLPLAPRPTAFRRRLLGLVLAILEERIRPVDAQINVNAARWAVVAAVSADIQCVVLLQQHDKID